MIFSNAKKIYNKEFCQYLALVYLTMNNFSHFLFLFFLNVFYGSHRSKFDREKKRGYGFIKPDYSAGESVITVPL